MDRLPLLSLLLLAILFHPPVMAQYSGGRIVSDHIQIQMPSERESLGREAIADLERSWAYIRRATDDNLPKKVWVVLTWDKARSSTEVRKSIITIGMNNRAAAFDQRSFLLHRASREMARLALLRMSGEAAGKPENAFLLQGVAEILSREFLGATRALESTWVVAHYLARMEELDLARLADWRSYSEGRQDIRSTAPGVTFYLTCRDQFGRDRARKLIPSLEKRTLSESIRSNLRRISDAVEYIWLKRLREFGPVEEVTVTSEEDAPDLSETLLEPDEAKPGSTLRIRMLIRDGGRNLSPGGIFMLDRESGKIYQPEIITLEGTGYMQVQLPIEGNRRSGEYGITVTAVDDAGNIRIWDRPYRVR
jgi:hypothetical protein